MNKYQVYIAGPISGYKDSNYSAFVDAADQIKGVRIHPTHTVNTPRDMPYEWYLELAFNMIKKCDMVLLLRGWEDSVGARTEVRVAESYGIPTMLFGRNTNEEMVVSAIERWQSGIGSEKR